MGLGTTPRPHHITWDYRAGYRASRRDVADTTHFLLSVSRQARKRARITHSGPSRPGNPGFPRAARLATGWCAAGVSPTNPVHAILPLAYRFGRAFAVLIVTGKWNVAAVSSETSHSASYRDTLIVKLVVVGISGLTAALHARAQHRGPRGFRRIDRRQRPGRVVPRRPAGRLSPSSQAGRPGLGQPSRPDPVDQHPSAVALRPVLVSPAHLYLCVRHQPPPQA